MKQADVISPRQLVAVAFVSVLSPLIRRFPRTLAAGAGRTCWLAVPMAAVMLAVVLWLVWLLLRNRPGEPLSGVMMDVLGSVPGRLITGLYALWLLFYAGFLLRSGAIRLISTVYQGANVGVFIVCMALVCAAAAAGPVRAVARSAMLLRPLLLTVPALIVLLTVKDADYRLLLPVTLDDLPADAFAALKITNLLAVAVFLAFCGNREPEPLRLRDWAGWTAALLALLGLMTAGCLGMFGPELTEKMTFPFFMLARDVTVLGALERVETVVIAAWVFADFLLLSVLFKISARNLCVCVTSPETPVPRWLSPVCAAAAAAAAFLLPDKQTQFQWLSEIFVPIASAVMTGGFPLLTLVVGKLRKKL